MTSRNDFSNIIIIVLGIISMIIRMKSQSYWSFGKIIFSDIQSSWIYDPDILNSTSDEQEEWLMIVVVNSNNNDNGPTVSAMVLLLVVPYPVHMKHSNKNGPNMWFHPPYPPWFLGGV